jgi:pimeloyl-ACP methyl ester carboxylesterase
LRLRNRVTKDAPHLIDVRAAWPAAPWHWQLLYRHSRSRLPGAAWWVPTAVGRFQIIASHQHILLLTLLLASTVVERATEAAQGNATVPRFEAASCPKLPGAEALAEASCGYLVVPEDRRRPNGRSIRLMVAIFPARSPEKRADPVVYLAGGPGDVAPLDVNGLIAANFIRDRDILVVSQRGTMFSEPALTCSSADDFARELLGLRFYSEATKRAHLAATEACHRELATTGADLSAYNSTENAADFADLRNLLGITTWNVYGTSYGSYLAQTLMRDHPEGIRSVVLDSVLPTTYTIPGNWWITRAGFDNLFQACVAETACNAAHPRIEETFTRLVNKFEAEPQTTTVREPVTGKDLKVLLDGGALVDWLRNQNYAVPLLRAAPDLIGGLAAGRPEAIEAIAKDRASRAPPPGPGVPALGFGLSYGVTCREDYPFATPEDLAAAGREAFPNYPPSVQGEGVGGWAYANDDCRDVWKVPAAPTAMRQPVASSIPTLLISGSFDTLTSLAGAKAAATSLSNATIISIPGVGHFVSPASPCAQAVIVSFLADPHAPDTSCVGVLKPPSFTSRASP